MQESELSKYPDLEAQIARRVKAGFGQGRGKDYKPWIRVHDFSSRGLSQRIPMRVTGRPHHVFSILEADFLYWMGEREGVRDIREQYPCLPLRDSLHLALKLGIRHPWDTRKDQPFVMTSDSRVTFLENGVLKDKVFSLKYGVELDRENVLRKLWLERRFWEERGIEWVLITERDIPQIFVQNAKWLHGFWRPDTVAPLLAPDVDRIGHLVLQRVVRNTDKTLGDITMWVDEDLSCTAGTSMKIVRHLIASKRWKVDMDLPLGPANVLKVLNVINSRGDERCADDQSVAALAGP